MSEKASWKKTKRRIQRNIASVVRLQWIHFCSLQIKFDITFIGSETIYITTSKGFSQGVKIKKANIGSIFRNLGLLVLRQKLLKIAHRIFPHLKFFKVQLRRIKVYDRK